MKIGIDGRFMDLPSGGLGRYSFELVSNLLKIDKENEFVLFVRSLKGASMFKKYPNLQIISAPFPHYSFSEQNAFLRLLLKTKLDFVHFTHFNHPLFYFRPFMVTVHDLTLSQFRYRGRFSQLAYSLTFKNVIKKAKKIITVSNFVRSQLKSSFNISSRKIATVYNGIEENFQPVTNSLSLKKVAQKYKIPGPYLLYLGQLYPHKNLERLIEAFNLLRQDPHLEIKGTKLVLAGPLNRFFPPLRELVKKLDLEEEVIFTGFVDDDDLPALISGAKAFVFPSLSEGFGIPGLEAMACGVPVVASDASSLPEILSESALYFNPFNVEEMAEKIKEVLLNKSFREKLIKKGFARAKEFSWSKTARETLEVYQKLGEQLLTR